MFLIMLKNKTKIAQIILLILLFVLIRLFEEQLFYDPFLAYYHAEFQHLPVPNYNSIKLFFSLGFRFYLNSVISLFLLYVLFKDTRMVKFSILLYMILGSLFMISFLFILNFFAEENKMTLFYIRRFIIHPILILLFIPGFYYQKKMK
jgi:exosortase F-associated protein